MPDIYSHKSGTKTIDNPLANNWATDTKNQLQTYWEQGWWYKRKYGLELLWQMISYKYSTVGGYFCAVIAVVGVIINTITFMVLGSQKKLRQQPTTVIVLAITMFDIFYTAVILPFHAISMLDCW
jgi:hypothetical protein